MSFSKPAHETSPANIVSTQEQLVQLSRATTQERFGLYNNITSQFSDVPQKAVGYLTINCKRPEHLPIALNVLRETLKQNPSLLDDEFEAEMELDDCLDQAESIALNTEIETEQSEGMKLDVKIDGLKNRITGNLTGADKAGQIMKLISDVKVADGFEEAERTTALKHLTQIANTLQQMSTAFADPVKQEAFQQIVTSSAIDLGASRISETFAPIFKQVEMSGVFTLADKKRLHMIITGSEVQDILSEKTEDGDYVHTEKNKRPIRSGVEGYTEPSGRQAVRSSKQRQDSISSRKMSLDGLVRMWVYLWNSCTTGT